MEYAGLVWSYAVNRPLTEEEKENRLMQDFKTTADPKHQVSLTRINSSFLECVDKFYAWKGFITLITGFALLVSGWMLYGIASISYDRIGSLSSEDLMEEVFWLVAFFIMSVPFLCAFFWVFKKEIFRYTHYPIRFNRITREVHVFRMNGSVLSVNWDDIFFTLNKGQMRDNWEVRGHVLAKDELTVLETFALPYFSSLNDPSMLSQWEFIRRYMEEGPANLIGQVDHVMQISQRRETFWNGFHRLVAEFGSFPIIAVVMMPVLFPIAVGRWIATQTSKIPQWPAEIEAQCIVVPDDKWIKE